MTQKDIADQIKSDIFMLGKDVAVLTEDFEDKSFWRDVLKTACPRKKLFFPNQLLQGAGGSGTLNKYRPFVDEKMIVCLDSDNRFIWSDGNIPFTNSFIYETFVYSIENFRYHPDALNDLLFKATLSEYDISDFLERYCEEISDIFLLLVYSEKNGFEIICDYLKEDDLAELFALDLTLFENKQDFDGLLKTLQVQIQSHLQMICEEIGEEWYNIIFDTELLQLKEYLTEQFGIEQSDYLQFLKGHLVEDSLIPPILKKLIAFLKEEEIEGISHQAELQRVRNEEKLNRIKNYSNRTNKDFQTLIEDNHNYHLRFPTKFFQKIITAIQRDFSTS